MSEPKGGEYWWVKLKKNKPNKLLLRNTLFVAFVEGREFDYTGEPEFVHIPMCEAFSCKNFEFVQKIEKPQ